MNLVYQKHPPTSKTNKKDKNSCRLFFVFCQQIHFFASMVDSYPKVGYKLVFEPLNTTREKMIGDTVRINLAMIGNKKISNGAQLLWAFLDAMADPQGFCRQTNKELASICNVCPRAIQKYLQQLERWKFISIKIEDSHIRTIRVYRVEGYDEA